MTNFSILQKSKNDKIGGTFNLRTYESVMVIDSLLKSEEIDGIIEKIERIISNNGGKIKETDLWGKKRLTYEIKKRQYGYFVDFMFEAPNNLITVLEREYSLDENILRYLTVHLNKRALKHIEQQKITKKEDVKKKAPDLANENDNSSKDVATTEDDNAPTEAEGENQNANSDEPIKAESEAE